MPVTGTPIDQLLQQLLSQQAGDRPSVTDALMHPYFQQSEAKRAREDELRDDTPEERQRKVYLLKLMLAIFGLGTCLKLVIFKAVALARDAAVVDAQRQERVLRRGDALENRDDGVAELFAVRASVARHDLGGENASRGGAARRGRSGENDSTEHAALPKHKAVESEV